MGVPVRGEYLYTLRFADDQVVIAQDEEDLSFLIRKLNEEYLKTEMEINILKSEYLTINEEEIKNLEVDDHLIMKGCKNFVLLRLSR